MIKNDIIEFANAYPKAREKYVRSKPNMPEIDGHLLSAVEGIKNVANISKPYGIKGSVGENNLFMPESPWIGVFDKSISNMSAQKGYYIVYLFVTDMSGFYLSLNQGFTQYQIQYGNREGRLQIKSNADLASQLLNGVLDFEKGPIRLKARNDLAKGYESGSICSKYYSINDLPDDNALARDLNNMIGLYRELKGVIGTDILQIKKYNYLIEKELDEQKYQVEVQEETEDYFVNDGPLQKPVKDKNSKSGSYLRNPRFAQEALKRAGYECELNSEHKTFIVRNSNHQFVEAHHLIPMSAQDDFKYSLDVPENIISVCPNCHRKVHYSNRDETIKLIKSLFEKRERGLISRGIVIDLKKLLEYYGIKSK